MRFTTALIWSASLVSLMLAALATTLFAVMASSIEPSDILTDGIDPFKDAAYAFAGFLVLLIVTGLSLRLWHTERFRFVSALLTTLESASVLAALVWIYRDYL